LLDHGDPIIMDWLFKRSEPEYEGLKWVIGRLQATSENIG